MNQLPKKPQLVKQTQTAQPLTLSTLLHNPLAQNIMCFGLGYIIGKFANNRANIKNSYDLNNTLVDKTALVFSLTLTAGLFILTIGALFYVVSLPFQLIATLCKDKVNNP